MDLLEKFAPKKKKPLVLTLGRFGAYTANPPNKGEKKKKKKKKKKKVF
jgi:hypothetical protein